MSLRLYQSVHRPIISFLTLLCANQSINHLAYYWLRRQASKQLSKHMIFYTESFDHKAPEPRTPPSHQSQVRAVLKHFAITIDYRDRL